jgi:uncharacterized protein YdhG (YjbR/CyaY superfamily)
MDAAVQEYLDAIPAEHRPLFDRVHDLILQTGPQVSVGISYRMPTYRVGRRRLYVGVWKHGVSLYGWGQGRDGGFTDRHPELVSGKGTVRLRRQSAASITDDELRALIGAALAP